MIKITDDQIEQMAKDYGNTMSNWEWSLLSCAPQGFANGMKYMRDLINEGVIHDTDKSIKKEVDFA